MPVFQLFLKRLLYDLQNEALNEEAKQGNQRITDVGEDKPLSNQGPYIKMF